MCAVCDDTGWVCEAHPDRPFRGFSSRTDACDCIGVGMPCEACNHSDADHPPSTGSSWECHLAPP
jgi:hypothetical protein